MLSVSVGLARRCLCGLLLIRSLKRVETLSLFIYTPYYKMKI